MAGTQTNHAVVPVLYARQVNYDGVRDFTPITQIACSPLLIVVNSSLLVRTVNEFLALAKARLGELAFGAASGGTNHMAVELLKLTTGVSMLVVPYKGKGPALTDTIDGQLAFQFGNLPTLLPRAHSGRLRGIAVNGAQRVSTAPQYPTVSGSGIPSYQAATWWELLGKAGMPGDIVMRLNIELARGLNDPAVREKLETMGIFTTAGTREQLAALLANEAPRWTKVVRESEIRSE